MTSMHRFLSLAVILAHSIGLCHSEELHFASAYGVNVLWSYKINNELYELGLSSSAVRGEQKVRILLPRDYATSGQHRRYPSLYLLHGSAGNAADWTAVGKAQEILGHSPLITVMPDGGSFGWYTNWLNPGNAAPQNWRTFHMEQLLPWIDFNLRTASGKESRAIIGLSMSGFGAIRYAEVYPDRFHFAAALSGALDLLDLRIQTAILSSMNTDNKPLDGPFGAALLPWTQQGWKAQNPITNAASLRGITLGLYTGNVGLLEVSVRDTNYRMRDALNTLNIPVHFLDYGNGVAIGGGCSGAHEFVCWNAALKDALPRMMAVLQQEY